MTHAEPAAFDDCTETTLRRAIVTPAEIVRRLDGTTLESGWVLADDDQE